MKHNQLENNDTGANLRRSRFSSDWAVVFIASYWHKQQLRGSAELRSREGSGRKSSRYLKQTATSLMG